MQAVLDAVVLFGALGVIPAVDGADEVARDAADALEFLRLELVADVDLTVLRGGELQAVDLFFRLSLNIISCSEISLSPFTVTSMPFTTIWGHQSFSVLNLSCNLYV